jgi:hypothetical protein
VHEGALPGGDPRLMKPISRNNLLAAVSTSLKDARKAR